MGTHNGNMVTVIWLSEILRIDHTLSEILRIDHSPPAAGGRVRDSWSERQPINHCVLISKQYLKKKKFFFLGGSFLVHSNIVSYPPSHIQDTSLISRSSFLSQCLRNWLCESMLYTMGWTDQNNYWLVSYLVFWAQSTTKNYTRARSKQKPFMVHVMYFALKCLTDFTSSLEN